MTDNVESFAAHKAKATNDNTQISVHDMLVDVAKSVESGDETATKALVLLLNDDGDDYDVGFNASNLRCSEMLALLDVARSVVLQQMGY